LAENIVRLRIRQNDYTDARVWLDIEQQLVNLANLEEQKHIRHYIPILYHRAVIFYRECKYVEAKTLFQEVMHSASIQTINREIA
jgi:hypothetical protein